MGPAGHSPFQIPGQVTPQETEDTKLSPLVNVDQLVDEERTEIDRSASQSFGPDEDRILKGHGRNAAAPQPGEPTRRRPDDNPVEI